MENIVKVVKQVLYVLAPYFKKEDSVHGVKEVKESIVALNEVALVVAVLLKDGLQASDAIAFYNQLMNNDEMKAKLIAAYDGYKAIPDELKDMDMGEGCELLALQADYLPSLLAAFKKEQA